MYFYENNPILLIQFSCLLISSLSILGVLIVFILGKGWQYFIVKLFATQIISMFFFYIPQILFPFFLNQLQDDNYNCNLNDNELNQRCIPEYFLKLQGYFINSSFIASSLISLYSCYAIKVCLTVNKIHNQNQIYFFHGIIALITFVICLPILFLAKFKYYGSTWNEEMIYYVSNIDFQAKDLYTVILFWFSLIINVVLLGLAIAYYIQVKRLRVKIKEYLQEDINNYQALNLYVLPFTLILCWTINLALKVIDFEFDFLRNLNTHWISIIYYLPQTLLPLQGFNYASIFFYAFHQQLVPNLPKSLRSTYVFFAKISVYNLIFGKIKNYQPSSESLIYQSDSANMSTSSLIKKDESSTNR